MKIEKAKELIYNGELTGYLVNENIYFPKDNCEQVKQWLLKGNIQEPEFSELEIINKNKAKFRAERNALLAEVDIEINKAEDLGESSLLLREYRQVLRDATITWVIPERK